MQIHRSSWLFQIAYVFTSLDDEPERVDRCTLVWRLILCFVPWLALVISYWFAFGLILGIGGHLFMWSWRFLAEARYPVLKDKIGEDEKLWLPGRKMLFKLCILGYGKKDIPWLDWMVRAMSPQLRVPSPDEYDGRLRSPIMFLIGCGVIVGMLALLFYLIPFYIAPWAWHAGIMPAIRAVYNTVGWWGWTLAAITILLLARYGWNKFAATNGGKIIISHFKEWKADHCPIYEVV